VKSAEDVCPVSKCPTCGSPRLHYCPGDVFAVAGWECRRCGEFIAGQQTEEIEPEIEEVA